MIALKIEETLDHIKINMGHLAPYRPPKLFDTFLKEGYRMVTLDCVPRERRAKLLQAKLCFGTLITLLDDFADRPAVFNPGLLDKLYQLNFDTPSAMHSLDPNEQKVIAFAQSLFSRMRDVLSALPNYAALKDCLHFDLSHVYMANHFSSLITANKNLNSCLENRLYLHHNMGMVAVGTMDLMASSALKMSELGSIRSVLLLGQRMGRIFNVLSTQKRELLDGDFTGEMSSMADGQSFHKFERRLQAELRLLEQKILRFEAQISTFSVQSYVDGLRALGRLHGKMTGVI